ncbi:MAG TPA: 4-alpha-glucanotransferase [Longimicrobiaceae bacterium]|nr:4-alpha-glucanotransferase [Longimicrobiaceae bacterium]
MVGRGSGVLLHPTSLPGGAIGSLGAEAYRFVDWLAEAGQAVWQILPLVAVDEGGSPYNGLSALAGNPLLIDVEAPAGAASTERVDFGVAARWKGEALAAAYRSLREGREPALAEELARYRELQAEWVEDYALFRVLRRAHDGAPWTRWARELRDRRPESLRRASRDYADEVERRVFQQMLFDRQWSALRRYANERGIRIVGDLPIFVAHDSADVWANRDLFLLDERGEPIEVAGVPPDYFSETGQRWGNPLYRWDEMRSRGYPWWVRRFRRTLEWVDVVRVDHFRGFESYWAIPAASETAVEGEWRKGPGAEFFRALERRLGGLPLVAEDLGLITPAVEALRDELDLPGMRVLQFAFDGDPGNPHLPRNYPANCVGYTGTHDNDTLAGWWEKASERERDAVRRLVGGDDGRPIEWEMMELLFRSDAALVVVPAQDVLGLGSGARMNTPGTVAGNWSWRLRPGELDDRLGRRLGDLARRTGRWAGGATTANGERDR